jgi:hypothetical protein
MKHSILGVAIAMLFGVVATDARAHGGSHGHKNLKVLAEIEHKAFDRSMKSFAKGLGVKCEVCHVKGKFEQDDVPAKLEARKFMDAVIGETDPAKRKAALDALLSALKSTAPKDEKAVWEAVSTWKKKS